MATSYSTVRAPRPGQGVKAIRSGVLGAKVDGCPNSPFLEGDIMALQLRVMFSDSKSMACRDDFVELVSLLCVRDTHSGTVPF